LVKISIITVCYNSSKTIERTINSVLKQKNKNIEYIIIDGASTDSTVSILNKYQNNISKIISEKDDGIYDALNKGVQLAKGDIIGFLHADDFYPSNNILSTVEDVFMDNEEINLAFGDVVFVNNEGGIIRYYSGKKFNFDIGIMPPHPSVFIKKKCYDKFGYFNTKYKIASDYDLLFRFMSLHKLQYEYSKDIIVHMALGGVSNKNILSSINLNKEIYKIHKSHNYPISILDLLHKISVRIKELLFH